MNGVRIFVSHSHEDDDFGRQLVTDLRDAIGDGDDAVWYDAAGGLRAGDDWWRKIIEELCARPIFLVILSPDSMASNWVNDEINQAWRLKNETPGRKIVPVLYRPCEMRSDIKGIHYVSFVEPKPYGAAFEELLVALEIERVGPKKLPQLWVQTDSISVLDGPSTQDFSQRLQEHFTVLKKRDLIERLRRAYDEDLKKLDVLYTDIWYSTPGNQYSDIERYRRVAYETLPSWRHSIYQSQIASMVMELDEQTVNRMHDLTANLNNLASIQSRMRQFFEAEESNRLWEDYQTWKSAYEQGNVQQRLEAQARRSNVEMRLSRFCLQHQAIWSAFNAVCQTIRANSNPIRE